MAAARFLSRTLLNFNRHNINSLSVLVFLVFDDELEPIQAEYKYTDKAYTLHRVVLW